MDPEACYRRVIELRDSGDEEGAREAYNDLREWVRKGGFPPKDTLWRYILGVRNA